MNKATSNDDNPTPGYVYPELIKLTHADVANCDKMSDWLYRRLQQSSPSVKWKVLLVMKLVSKGGRMEFKRALQRQNEAVKQCLQFKGPPDPLRGDEPYRKVKDAAKDALEAMFASDAPAGGGAAAMSGRITGVSSGAFPPPNAPNYPPPAPGASSGGGGGSSYGGPGGSGGFSTAMPGQPGYDPNSPMHRPPQSSGQMESFGNYDPNKDKSRESPSVTHDTHSSSRRSVQASLPYKCAAPSHRPPPFPPPLCSCAIFFFDLSTHAVTSAIFSNIKSAFTTAVPPSGAAAAGRPATNDFRTSGGGGAPPPAASSYDPRFPPPASSSSSSSYNPGAAGAGQGFGASTGERRAGQPGGGWGAPSGGAGGGASGASSSFSSSSSSSGGGSGSAGAAFGMGRRSVLGAGGAGVGVGSGGSVGGGVSDGAFERGVIEDLTSAGGLRAMPDKDKLEAFLKTGARTLDAALLGKLLDERLNTAGDGAPGDMPAAKACAVIEAVGATGAGGGCAALRTHLYNSCDLLLEVMEGEGVRPPIRSAAFKALKALGVQVTEPAGLAGSAAQQQQQQQSYAVPTTSLASFNAGVAPVVGGGAATGGAAAVDLLGLDMGAGSSGGPTAASAAVPVPVAAPAATGGFLFSGLSQPTQQAVQQQQQQQQQQGGAAGLTDMFGGMSLGGVAPAAAAASAAGTAAGGFSFAAPQQAQQPPAPAAAAPAAGGGVSGGGSSAAAQQLLSIQSQLQALTVAMATSPAAHAALLPQVMALHAQQAALLASMTGGGGGGEAPAAAAPAAAAAVGGFSFAAAPQQQQAAPTGPLALNGQPLARAPVAPPPPQQPKQHDPFSELNIF